ncbi:nuclear transport factor 2 family protein [Dickeya dadantii]|uniref:nuclear transport factor 2 family protein n=1 Tax=Dickeya dadantii TaxID=204038 RepID=UPI001CF145FD|nr:nuclear transport factor 2 family protein [Dickeya dadantii]MCA7014961.1 nuclear transport factor 2 family protein [Dickeya dadantii]
MVREIFDNYILAVLEKSPEMLSELFSDDAILSMPFRKERPVISGKAAIFQYYSDGFCQAPLLFSSIENVQFHQTTQLNRAVTEYRLNGKSLIDGKAFYCLYINVITVEEGKITALVDYEDVLNREMIFSV